jgi:ribosomal protein S18 acetylase RimI-like enzyme
MGDWWPNSSVSKERLPEDQNTGWKSKPHEPITHWLNVEDFLKERYPEAATGSYYGLEDADKILDFGQKSEWDIPQHILERNGYTGAGNVITQAMLNLHNKLQGRSWATESDKHRYYELMLKHIGPGARRLAQLLRTAYRIKTAYYYDDGPYWAMAWDGWDDDDDDDEEEKPRKTSRLFWAMPAPAPEGLRFRHDPNWVHPNAPTEHARYLGRAEAYVGDEPVGHIDWLKKGNPLTLVTDRKPGEVNYIHVRPDYRRQSIATEMYDWAKKNAEPDLHHSERRTNLGDSWMAHEQRRQARKFWAGEKLGDCYEAAGRHVMYDHLRNPKSTLRLVHGEVAGQGPMQGKTFGHAWVEDGDTVFDPSNGGNLRMPKKSYYALGKINELNNFHSYSPQEAARQMVELQHFGPWHLTVNGEAPPGRVELADDDDEYEDDEYEDDHRFGARFWTAMSPAEDAYDQNPKDYQRAQTEMPLRENTSGKWYHVSPHKMEPDTILSPGGGASPYASDNVTQRQKDWVWMDGPDAVKQWYYGTLLGQIQQGHENPWAHIYEVEPSEGPHPWNGSGQDGHVSPSARIVREIDTDKYNRLPDHLGSQRFWAMADTTKWHPMIKHDAPGFASKMGLYHITIPDKMNPTGRRIGDLSYTKYTKGEKHYAKDDKDGRWRYMPRPHSEAYIDSLIVHPDFQGQGVAQALVERLAQDHPEHRINPGATTPQGTGLTERLRKIIPEANDRLVPNYDPVILDDSDTEDFTRSELNRLVNARLWRKADAR